MTFPDLAETYHPGAKEDQEDCVYMTADSWREPISDEQQRLLASAKQIGWAAALKAEMADQGMLNYVTDHKRVAVLDVIPLEVGQRVLEIGPGYGQMTEVLARRAATVDALEPDLGQARFVSIRCRQQGFRNVRVVAGGADGLLPYASNSFDGVIMNLVLEWSAVRSTVPPPELQAMYLRDINRVLKPSGYLFLSTKNRYSLRLLTGGRDEHMANLRFGSALPRSISRLLLGSRQARGYLHSYRALRSMLKRSRFDVLKAYWTVPNMRWPKSMVPLSNIDINSFRSSNPDCIADSPRLSLLMKFLPSSFIKHLTPNLTFIARNSREKE